MKLKEKPHHHQQQQNAHGQTKTSRNYLIKYGNLKELKSYILTGP